MYVHDVGTSFHTTEESLEFYFESKKCWKEGSFELRNWNANNKKVIDKRCV